MPQATAIARSDPGTGRRNGRVARAVVFRADERFDDASALHFVVVLANHPFLARDVWRTENREERGFEFWHILGKRSGRR